ncbi:MAG: porphobilinogen synthase [Candidatus Omnitrophica bacterium]|nr:porphobilinogen synthase [Candidatus Omnitrophota bacterium]
MPFQPRRLRQHAAFRGLLRETRLAADQLVMPLFVRPGKQIRIQIPSMPGQFQFSVDRLVEECVELQDQGIRAVLLFGMASGKDERATEAYAKDGVVPQAVRAIKTRVPDLAVITDVCLCAYTSHGHCGVLKTAHSPQHTAHSKKTRGLRASSSEHEVVIDEKASLELLAKTALAHAQAGADMVAPSDMLDGRVAVIRQALDRSGFSRVPIMSYAAKFASSFYGPFRDAVESRPMVGDRRSYQLDPANAREALREIAADIDEGADIVMVKPALAYLDIIARAAERFTVPLAAFNVSGEYAMVKAAGARGWLLERPAWLEMLLAIRRAGADLIITYWAKEAAKALRDR